MLMSYPIMKASKQIAALCAALFLAIPAATAQDATAKAKMAEIRTAYTNAMNQAKANQAADSKNTMVFQSVQTDPNGVWKRKLEFICGQDYIEPLDLYYPTVQLIRETHEGAMEEYLYDPEGELMFVYERITPEGEATITEYRYYYVKGVPFWKIEKTLDKGSGKALETKQEAIADDDGNAYFLGRVGHDLYVAFEALTVIYD